MSLAQQLQSSLQSSFQLHKQLTDYTLTLSGTKCLSMVDSSVACACAALPIFGSANLPLQAVDSGTGPQGATFTVNMRAVLDRCRLLQLHSVLRDK
jgi:hypothetical protein